MSIHENHPFHITYQVIEVRYVWRSLCLAVLTEIPVGPFLVDLTGVSSV